MSVTVLMILFTLQITTSNIQEQQCDFLYGQGCICNLSQVLADIQDILTYPVSVHFVNDLLSEASVRIVQYQCKDYKPLPPGFDVTLQTTPSRVAGLSNDSGRLSFSSEEFAKRLYEYTLVENGKCNGHCLTSEILGAYKIQNQHNTFARYLPTLLYGRNCRRMFNVHSSLWM